ncbi:MAG: hypothetical protein K2K97_02510 [Muribaculaceae bacterium]|nr:hypothetical protein [Muribaculaceae bacterium]
MEIKFSDKIRVAAPGLRVLAVEAEVHNPPTSDALWHEIEKEEGKIRKTYSIDKIKDRSAISATRKAYKALGKDPNRYRPAAEALSRRVVNGKELYRLTTLVDLINLLSLHTGHSIGGFDADKIEGRTLFLDVGTKDDIYHGIGRGLLNIEGLPVYRDAAGGIGTPTSDEERTKLTESTTHLLMLINVYDETTDLPALEQYTLSLLTNYCNPIQLHSAIHTLI